MSQNFTARQYMKMARSRTSTIESQNVKICNASDSAIWRQFSAQIVGYPLYIIPLIGLSHLRRAFYSQPNGAAAPGINLIRFWSWRSSSLRMYYDAACAQTSVRYEKDARRAVQGAGERRIASRHLACIRGRCRVACVRRSALCLLNFERHANWQLTPRAVRWSTLEAPPK